VGEFNDISVLQHSLHNTRLLGVWLPPGYRSPEHAAERYPVLYLNDGQDLFDAGTSMFNSEEWVSMKPPLR